MTDTETTTETCISCGEPVTTDGTDDTRWANLAEGWMCWPCYETAEQYLTHVYHFTPDSPTPMHIYWADEFAFDEYGEPVDPRDEYGLVKGWHSTDAWRGYTDIRMAPGTGWTNVDEGAALWGQTTSVMEVADNIRVMAEDGDLDREYLVVIGITSNVFSQTVDIFAQETEEE